MDEVAPADASAAAPAADIDMPDGPSVGASAHQGTGAAMRREQSSLASAENGGPDEVGKKVGGERGCLVERREHHGPSTLAATREGALSALRCLLGQIGIVSGHVPVASTDWRILYDVNHDAFWARLVANGYENIYGPYVTLDDARKRHDLEAVRSFGPRDAASMAFDSSALMAANMDPSLRDLLIHPSPSTHTGVDDEKTRAAAADGTEDPHAPRPSAAAGPSPSTQGFAPDAPQSLSVGVGTSRSSAELCDYDAIVIGAGTAGLVAARDCLSHKLTVGVFEARDQAGGRIRSHTLAGTPTHSHPSSQASASSAGQAAPTSAAGAGAGAGAAAAKEDGVMVELGANYIHGLGGVGPVDKNPLIGLARAQGHALGWVPGREGVSEPCDIAAFMDVGSGTRVDPVKVAKCDLVFRAVLQEIKRRARHEFNPCQKHPLWQQTPPTLMHRQYDLAIGSQHTTGRVCAPDDPRHHRPNEPSAVAISSTVAIRETTRRHEIQLWKDHQGEISRLVDTILRPPTSKWPEAQLPLSSHDALRRRRAKHRNPHRPSYADIALATTRPGKLKEQFEALLAATAPHDSLHIQCVHLFRNSIAWCVDVPGKDKAYVPIMVRTRESARAALDRALLIRERLRRQAGWTPSQHQQPADGWTGEVDPAAVLEAAAARPDESDDEKKNNEERPKKRHKTARGGIKGEGGGKDSRGQSADGPRVAKRKPRRKSNWGGPRPGAGKWIRRPRTPDGDPQTSDDDDANESMILADRSGLWGDTLVLRRRLLPKPARGSGPSGQPASGSDSDSEGAEGNAVVDQPDGDDGDDGDMEGEFGSDDGLSGDGCLTRAVGVRGIKGAVAVRGCQVELQRQRAADGGTSHISLNVRKSAGRMVKSISFDVRVTSGASHGKLLASIQVERPWRREHIRAALQKAVEARDQHYCGSGNQQTAGGDHDAQADGTAMDMDHSGGLRLRNRLLSKPSTAARVNGEPKSPSARPSRSPSANGSRSKSPPLPSSPALQHREQTEDVDMDCDDSNKDEPPVNSTRMDRGDPDSEPPEQNSGSKTPRAEGAGRTPQPPPPPASAEEKPAAAGKKRRRSSEGDNVESLAKDEDEMDDGDIQGREEGEEGNGADGTMTREEAIAFARAELDRHGRPKNLWLEVPSSREAFRLTVHLARGTERLSKTLSVSPPWTAQSVRESLREAMANREAMIARRHAIATRQGSRSRSRSKRQSRRQFHDNSSDDGSGEMSEDSSSRSGNHHSSQVPEEGHSNNPSDDGRNGSMTRSEAVAFARQELARQGRLRNMSLVVPTGKESFLWSIDMVRDGHRDRKTVNVPPWAFTQQSIRAALEKALDHRQAMLSRHAAEKAAKSKDGSNTDEGQQHSPPAGGRKRRNGSKRRQGARRKAKAKRASAVAARELSSEGSDDDQRRREISEQLLPQYASRDGEEVLSREKTISITQAELQRLRTSTGQPVSIILLHNSARVLYLRVQVYNSGQRTTKDFTIYEPWCLNSIRNNLATAIAHRDKIRRRGEAEAREADNSGPDNTSRPTKAASRRNTSPSRSPAAQRDAPSTMTSKEKRQHDGTDTGGHQGGGGDGQPALGEPAEGVDEAGSGCAPAAAPSVDGGDDVSMSIHETPAVCRDERQLLRKNRQRRGGVTTDESKAGRSLPGLSSTVDLPGWGERPPVHLSHPVRPPLTRESMRRDLQAALALRADDSQDRPLTQEEAKKAANEELERLRDATPGRPTFLSVRKVAPPPPKKPGITGRPPKSGPGELDWVIRFPKSAGGDGEERRLRMPKPFTLRSVRASLKAALVYRDQLREGKDAEGSDKKADKLDFQNALAFLQEEMSAIRASEGGRASCISPNSRPDAQVIRWSFTFVLSTGKHRFYVTVERPWTPASLRRSVQLAVVFRDSMFLSDEADSRQVCNRRADGGGSQAAAAVAVAAAAAAERSEPMDVDMQPGDAGEDSVDDGPNLMMDTEWAVQFAREELERHGHPTLTLHKTYMRKDLGWKLGDAVIGLVRRPFTRAGIRDSLRQAMAHLEQHKEASQHDNADSRGIAQPLGASEGQHQQQHQQPAHGGEAGVSEDAQPMDCDKAIASARQRNRGARSYHSDISCGLAMADNAADLESVFRKYLPVVRQRLGYGGAGDWDEMDERIIDKMKMRSWGRCATPADLDARHGCRHPGTTSTVDWQDRFGSDTQGARDKHARRLTATDKSALLASDRDAYLREHSDNLLDEAHKPPPSGSLAVHRVPDMDEANNTRSDWLVANGYGKLVIEPLLGEIAEGGGEVHYGCRVSRVAYHADRRHGQMEITLAPASQSSKKVYRCRYVVAALPLGVLQASLKCHSRQHQIDQSDTLQRSLVRFDPPLSAAKRASIGRLGMGTHNKIFLRFATTRGGGRTDHGSGNSEHPFWREYGSRVNIATTKADYPMQILNLHPYGKRGTLCVQVYPPLSIGYGGKDDKQVVDECLDVLRAMFKHLQQHLGEGVDVLPRLLDWKVTHWDTEPEALGSYSYIAKGSDEADIVELSSPEYDGHLTLAGEATSREGHQCVTGAWLSGQRAARHVLANAARHSTRAG